MRFAANEPGSSGGPEGASGRQAGGEAADGSAKAPREAGKPPKAGSSAKENGPENPETAQPSAENGVREDMASLVIDNPAMAAGLNVGLKSGGPGRESDANRRPVPENAAASGAEKGAGAERSDAEIMLAVAAGDEAGYTYLVGKYHRQIIHFLYRMVHNEAVAEELAQEVFLRVYRSRESYRAEAKFSTWLYRIATNLAVNHARDTKHERTAQTLELDSVDAETGTTPEVADDDPNIEQRMLREERMAAIRAQVAALPERQRMAVLMHKYQEMDYRQIGDVLKLSESATKSLLFRAYQSLRESLKSFV
jgi:RNA polymerase sigma-70 factor (ECF subfamily)